MTKNDNFDWMTFPHFAADISHSETTSFRGGTKRDLVCAGIEILCAHSDPGLPDFS
jgi:hypothetical protein